MSLSIWPILEMMILFVLAGVVSSFFWAGLKTFSSVSLNQTDHPGIPLLIYGFQTDSNTFSQQGMIFWQTVFAYLMAPYCYLPAAFLLGIYCVYHLV